MTRLIILVMVLWPALVMAAQADVKGLRVWAAPDNTRLVLDVSRAVEHSLFTLDNPQRVVVDVKNARLRAALPAASSKGLIAGVRSAPRGKHDLRVVVDLRGKARPKTFLLKPNKQYGHRLVIDLADPDVAERRAASKAPAHDPSKPRDVVIAIDAGHGGEDPGAIGHKGTFEKNVTLQLAQRLKAMVDAEPGMRAVLTRDGDYFLRLRTRMKKAREARADLFISIHADAFRDPKVRGASVYVLSTGGASSEAGRWLADQENAADLIGGVSLDDKDDVLASVLLDLSQSFTMESSIEAAADVAKAMRKQTRMHKKRVQKAGFVVLKAPDLPSMLIETAFISNPQDERRLTNPASQQATAAAIMDGIRSYFTRKPPADTILAQRRRHVIENGDTLSEIAERYRVPVTSLRTANSLSSDRLRIGQVLQIPRVDG